MHTSNSSAISESFAAMMVNSIDFIGRNYLIPVIGSRSIDYVVSEQRMLLINANPFCCESVKRNGQTVLFVNLRNWRDLMSH